MIRLTERQQEALNFVAGYLRRNGKAPSYREIGRALGLSSLGTVAKHLEALEERGLVRRAERKSCWRALELTKAARAVL